MNRAPLSRQATCRKVRGPNTVPTPCPALCPGPDFVTDFLWSAPLAPPPPRAEAHPSLCSKASQLLWACQTSRIRTSLSCSLRIHSADPDATQDQMRDLPACASSCDNDLVLPSVPYDAVGPPKFILLSRLNIQPARLPVNASPLLSRTTTHDSGPIWFATPSLGGTCTRETYRFVPSGQNTRMPSVGKPHEYFVTSKDSGTRCSKQKNASAVPTGRCDVVSDWAACSVITTATPVLRKKSIRR